ncbi:MAG: GerMN domain-containing protein [bacterium]
MSENEEKNKKSPKKKTGNRKSQKVKRAEAERITKLGAGFNFVFFIVVLLIFGSATYLIWDFLGRPGLPKISPKEKSVYVELYFMDNTVAWLVPVHRKATLAGSGSKTELAIREWAAGPRDPSLARVYPVNVEIPTVTRESDCAVINLPKEIVGHMGGTFKERAFLDAITLTAVSAGECSKVRLLLDGALMRTTPEGYEIDDPLLPPEYPNEVPGSSVDEESDWATVYYLDSTATYLVPISIRIPKDSNKWQHAAEALLDHPPAVVQPPPMPIAPTGYTLEKVVIESGTASVDIRVPDTQTAFLGYDFTLFKEAVWLTLKKCCDIKNLEIKLNGKPSESYGRFGDLPDPANNENWNIERRTDNVVNPVGTEGNK